MAIWNRGKNDANGTDGAKHISPWSTAKFIESTDAENPAKLPLGWYIYKQNYQWHGLKPNDSCTGFLKGYDFQSVSEAEKWLGVSAPQELLQAENNRQSIAEQLRELNAPPSTESVPVQSAIVSAPAGPPVVHQPVSRRKRNIDIHIKVTPEEYAAIREKVELSEMTQTDFLIAAALKTEIILDQNKEQIEQELQQLNEHLQQLRAEVGRIGGMLKMTIKPNIGQRELKPKEWESLIVTIRFLASVKDKISKTMEAINGYSKTHFV